MKDNSRPDGENKYMSRLYWVGFAFFLVLTIVFPNTFFLYLVVFTIPLSIGFFAAAVAAWLYPGKPVRALIILIMTTVSAFIGFNHFSGMDVWGWF